MMEDQLDEVEDQALLGMVGSAQEVEAEDDEAQIISQPRGASNKKRGRSSSDDKRHKNNGFDMEEFEAELQQNQ